MPLNDPSAPGALYRPRLRVMVNGIIVPTAYAADTTQQGGFHADRFSAQFALVPSGIGSLAWWQAQGPQPPALAAVQLGYIAPGDPEGAVAAWVSVVIGEIDRRSIHLRQNMISVEGRDLTSRLIDCKRQQAFANQTSSEIVTSLAGQHGLTASVTRTTTPAGRYYELEHDAISLGQFHRVTTDWDMCITLARFEGYDCYVSGTTLFFAPPAAANSNPYVIQWRLDNRGVPVSNALDLTMERADTIAKGIQVIVKSWNAKQGRGFTRGAPSNLAINNTGNSTTQQYVFIRPNLTEDAAQQLANQLYQDISQHERRITTPLVPDLILTPRVLVRLEGTGTDFDQTYYPDEVRRSISADHFGMSLSAKNHSPQGDAATGL